MRLGDRGAEVSELQRRLQEVWVYRGPEDGDYSERVEEAVAEYQRWVSVTSDPPGVYGPETLSVDSAPALPRSRIGVSAHVFVSCGNKVASARSP
ncbi:peptidoglycan-binding domain-containing protein [Streptomyces sp. NRRL S-15]|uniref:peptidoglycan-binding domain-containing protein n=1 Tax=Streptomyces sp. NRRL S-15 TaxID=1463886 RepID=UPI002D21DC38|nr:peptidoglycan-binding domain-containing protein [Streptomyces sp. NRRL S-15]